MPRTHSRSSFVKRLSLLALILMGLMSGLTHLHSGNSAAAGTDDASSATSRPDQATQARVSEAYSNLPLRFETNQGQTDSNVRFLSHGKGSSLFLTPTEAVLALSDSSKGQSGTQETRMNMASRAVLRMKLLGAAVNPQIEGRTELPGKSNYFIGNDPQRWQRGVPGYSQVHYSEIYPGVGMVYYGTQRQLEYDFVIAPGTDPGVIKLGFDGAERIKIDEHGDLLLDVGGRQVRQHKPVIYLTEAGGTRRETEGGYILKGDHTVGFKIGAYDTDKPLIIDPVLSYSTYLGGSDTDIGDSIAIDSSGNAYLTGTTASTDFPTTTSPFQPNLNGTRSDVFVTKLNAAGTALVYSTYVGGSNGDVGNGIDVDDSGNAYVTGSTVGSPMNDDFPVTPNAYDGSFNGTDDTFLFKLNPNGTALVYSTFLGGEGTDTAQDIAVNRVSGEAYLAGHTDSRNFPTTPGAFRSSQTALQAGDASDGFVVKFNAQGSALVYSTQLGGNNGAETVNDIAIDGLGNAYLAGQTNSSLFPTTTGAFQTTCVRCNVGEPDAFVTKLNSEGTALVYSTYLGGSQTDIGYGIAIDSSGNAYVTGLTESGSGSTRPFPTTTGAFQTTGGIDAFVTKLNATGTALIYSTYLGGGVRDEGRSVAVDGGGNVYVTGLTRSTDFPLVNPVETASAAGADNVFITALNPSGEALSFSTFFGKGEGRQIVVDTSEKVYVTGKTFGDLPTANAIQPANGGSSPAAPSVTDAFVAKINLSGEIPTTPTASFNINGRVADGSNNSVADVTITLTLRQGGTITDTRTIQTDANGNYSFRNLPLGQDNARVEPSKTGFTFSPIAVGFVDSRSLNGDHTANFTAIPDGTPPPTLQFNRSAYSINEDIPVAGIGITVTRSGNTGVPVTVDYATTDGTAQAGTDYTSSSGTLSFAAGDTSKFFIILITNDNIDEADETVNLTLSNPGGAVLGNPATAVLTIVDDDVPPSITSPTPPTLVMAGDSYNHTFKATGQPSPAFYVSAGTLPPGLSLSSGGVLSGIANRGGLYSNITVKASNGVSPDATQTFSIRVNNPPYPGPPEFYKISVNTSLTVNAPGILANDNDANGDPLTAVLASNPLHGSVLLNADGSFTYTPARDFNGGDSFDYRISDGYSTSSQAGTVYISVLSGGTLKFPSGSPYTVREDAGSIEMQVLRTGDCFGETTVAYATSDGTAQAGVDYTPVSGTLTFAGGQQYGFFTIPVINDSINEGNETINLTLSNVTGTGTLGAPNTAVLTILNEDTPTLRFSQTSYDTTEGAGSLDITVTRLGDPSIPVAVNYATSDAAGLQNCDVVNGIASSRCDYVAGVGTLHFAAGETSRNISLPIVDDVYPEGTEGFYISLSNPTGGVILGNNQIAVVRISDNGNDGAGAANPIDQTDFFVRQHYIDFLGREPDPLSIGWVNQINNCRAGDTRCDRLATSQGIYLSPEFKDRGFFIYKFYAVALGRKPGYGEFVVDRARVSGFQSDAELEQSKVDFINDFMNRSEFHAIYDQQATARAYVETMLLRANMVYASKEDLIARVEGGRTSRAAALRELAESVEAGGRFLSEATIVMHYFGYLRRDPDAFYQDWINILTSTGDSRNVTNGFVNSAEYRMRFGR